MRYYVSSSKIEQCESPLQFSSDICIVSEHRAIKEKDVIMAKTRISKYRNLIALLYNKFIDKISKIFELENL